MSLWEARAAYINQSTSALERYVKVGDELKRVTKMTTYQPIQDQQANTEMMQRIHDSENSSSDKPMRMPSRGSGANVTSSGTGWGKGDAHHTGQSMQNNPNHNMNDTGNPAQAPEVAQAINEQTQQIHQSLESIKQAQTNSVKIQELQEKIEDQDDQLRNLDQMALDYADEIEESNKKYADLRVKHADLTRNFNILADQQSEDILKRERRVLTEHFATGDSVAKMMKEKKDTYRDPKKKHAVATSAMTLTEVVFDPNSRRYRTNVGFNQGKEYASRNTSDFDDISTAPAIPPGLTPTKPPGLTPSPAKTPRSGVRKTRKGKNGASGSGTTPGSGPVRTKNYRRI